MNKRIKHRIKSISNKRVLLVYLLFIFGTLLFASLLFLISYNNKKGATGEAIYKTYYVRVDGGTGSQCNGLYDAAYPGTGTSQDCAWKHPFIALPPIPGSLPVVFKGGDTLIIGRGSYKMGYYSGIVTDLQLVSEVNQYGYCAAGGGPVYSCALYHIPSGPDSNHPTRILGEGYDSRTGEKPELFATSGARQVINLAGSDNVEIRWLDLTDRSICSFNNTSCDWGAPNAGHYGYDGIRASNSEKVLLRDLDVHGFYHYGIWASRLTDWTLEDVRIIANTSGGWDGSSNDLCPWWETDADCSPSSNSNSGTITMKRVEIGWNGCGETYPEQEPVFCKGDGSGDGLGTMATGGNWIIEDSYIHHNTADGLDLLYHTQGGQITLNRVRADSNAGNAIKGARNVNITNSVLVGNCNFFNLHPEYRNNGLLSVVACRAGGHPLSYAFMGRDSLSVTNSTLYSLNGGLIVTTVRDNDPTAFCDGSERVNFSNNILLGDPNMLAAPYVQEWCSGIRVPMNVNNNILYHVKNNQSGTQNHLPGTVVDPLLVAPTVAGGFDMHLTVSSPAIDAGVIEGAPLDDFDGGPRVANPDIGAYEYVSPDTTTPIISLASSYTNYVGYPIIIEPIVSYADDFSWSVVDSNNVTDPILFDPLDGKSKNTIVVSNMPTGKDQGYQIKLRALNTASTNSVEKTTRVFIHKIADINGDNSINFTDFSLLLSNWGTSNNPMTNIVRGGASIDKVDFQDFSTLLSKWGS